MDSPEVRSRSIEDYLKTIFTLEEEHGGAVTTSRLAERLGLAPSSVSGMVKKLANEQLLHHRPYAGVTLTDSGRTAALRMVRRHRLIELFLIAHLGYRWDEVHDEAETLEHAVSDRLIERMDAALGQPRFDPHGDPIPSADGRLPTLDVRRLDELEPGTAGILLRVDDRDPDMLRHLTALGIELGQTLQVKQVLPFDGGLQISTPDGQLHLLPQLVTRALWVNTQTTS